MVPLTIERLIVFDGRHLEIVKQWHKVEEEARVGGRAVHRDYWLLIW